MKNIRYIILGLFLMIFPVNAYAITGNVLVSCNPTQAKPGDTVACSISGTTDEEIKGINIKVAITGTASISSFSGASDVWSNTSLSDGQISNSADELVAAGTFQIGTLNVKVGDEAADGQIVINLSDVKITDNEGNAVDTTFTAGSASIDVTSPSVVTAKGLRNLSPTVSNFGKQFSSTDLSYYLIIPGDATSFGFTFEAEDSSDEVVFLNEDDSTNTPLDPNNIAFATTGGKDGMLININVGSGDRLVTYTIAIKKDVATEDKSYELSSLKVGDQTVTLVSGKYDGYVVRLKDVSSYEIEVDLKDRTNYEAKFISPRTGTGDFTIIVTPKDNSSGLKEKTYTISVIQDDNAPSPSTSSSSSKPAPVINNPTTGGTISIIMAIVLMASFGASVYFYKRNMNYFND